MFKLQIGEQTFEFNSQKEKDDAARTALLSGKVVIDIPSEAQGPQTEIESKESVTDEQGFSANFQQAAPSADVELENVAQEDTVLSPEDTSSGLPTKKEDKLANKSVKINNDYYAADVVIESIRKGDIKIPGRISTSLYNFQNGNNIGVKDNITDETLLDAYMANFKNAKLVDALPGGQLDEVVLSSNVIPSEEGGTNPFGTQQELAEELAFLDWKQQRARMEEIAANNDKISIKSINERASSKGLSTGIPKYVKLTYDNDPSTTIKIYESTKNNKKAKDLIDFSNKYVDYDQAVDIASTKIDRSPDSSTGKFNNIVTNIIDSEKEDGTPDINLDTTILPSFITDPEYLRGRSLTEMYDNPKFVDLMVDKAKEEYISKYPEAELPADQAMKATVQLAVSTKIAEETKLRTVATVTEIDEMGEDVFNKTLQEAAMISLKGSSEDQYNLYLNINKQDSLSAELKKTQKRVQQGQAVQSKVASIKEEIAGLQTDEKTLQQLVDPNGKPYLNILTQARMSKADYDNLSSAEQEKFEDVSEDDKKYREYLKLLPRDKMRAQYYEHIQLMKNVSERSQGKFYLPNKETGGAVDYFLIKQFADKDDQGRTISTDKGLPISMSALAALIGNPQTEGKLEDVVGPDVYKQMEDALYYLKKDRATVARQDQAITDVFLLNRNIESMDQNAGDVFLRAGEVILGAVTSEDALASTGNFSQRAKLDNIKEFMEDSEIVLSDQEKSLMARGFGMKVVEGVSAFVPELAKFAVANKVAGAIGVTNLIRGLTTADKVIRRGTRLQRAFGKINVKIPTIVLNPNQSKLVGHAIGAGIEELKFKLVTKGESHTGGGFGFYLGGLGMRALIPFRFRGELAVLNPTFEKVGLGGIGGATSSEVAALVEGLYKNFSESGAFKAKLDELYGQGRWSDDTGEGADGWGERFLINASVFGLIGGTNLKYKTDFLLMRKVQEKLTSLTEEINRHEDGTKKLSNKELQQKYRLASLLGEKQAQSDPEQYKMDMGGQIEAMRAAEKIINTNKVDVLDRKGNRTGSVEATPMDIRNAEIVINRTIANRALVQNRITRQAKMMAEAEIWGGTEMTSEVQFQETPLSNGDKANVTVSGKKIMVKVDITKFRPGVLGHELGHVMYKAAFKSDPALAKSFYETMQPHITKSLEGIKFTVNGEKDLNFDEALQEAYKERNTAEEYMFNVLEFLGRDQYRYLLLSDGLLTGISKDIKNLGIRTGLVKPKKGQTLTSATEVIDFLNTMRTTLEKGNSKAIKNTFEAFKNINITSDGLVNTAGQKILGPKQAGKAIEDFVEGRSDSSMDIEMSEQGKSIRLKEQETAKEAIIEAKKVYERQFSDVDNLTNMQIRDGGLMVGFTLRPWIMSEVNKFVNSNGNLTLGKADREAVVDKITMDFTEKGDGIGENVYGGQGIVGSLNSFIKKAKLISYIEKNNPTPEQIDAKAKELLVIDSGKEDAIKMASGQMKKANFMTYLTGSIRLKILGEITGKDSKYIFETQSMDSSLRQYEDITNESDLTDVDKKDNIVTELVVKPKKRTVDAFKVMEIPELMGGEIAQSAKKVLLTNKLENIDVASKGTIELADGVIVDYVMPDYTSAIITYPDGTVKNVSKFRGPGELAKKLGAVGKVKKDKAVTTKLLKEATDAIYANLESVAGSITNNKQASTRYKTFVENAFELWENGYISLSQANKRFSSFTELAIGADGEVIKKKTNAKNKSGGKLRQKRKITPDEWNDYFIGDGTERIDGRRRSLLEALSGEFGFDSMYEHLISDAMKEQIESRQEILNVKLVENYASLIIKEMDRGDLTQSSADIFEQVSKIHGVKAKEDLMALLAGQDPENIDMKSLTSNSLFDLFFEGVTKVLGKFAVSQNRMYQPSEVIDKNLGETNYTKFKAQGKDRGLQNAEKFARFNSTKKAFPGSSEGRKQEVLKNERIILETLEFLLSDLPPEFLNINSGNSYKVTKKVGENDVVTEFDLGSNFIFGFYGANSRMLGLQPGKTLVDGQLKIVDKKLFNTEAARKLALKPGEKQFKSSEKTELTEGEKEQKRLGEEFFNELKEFAGQGELRADERSAFALKKQIQEFEQKYVEINNSEKGEAERKAELIELLETKEGKAAVKQMELKEKFLQLQLLNMGNKRAKLEKELLDSGKSLKQINEKLLEFDLGVSFVLFNGDNSGIRSFSFEKYFQITRDGVKINKLKNEHAEPKLAFTINALKSLQEGRLTNIGAIKDLTKAYTSIMGAKEGQKFSDFFTGTTVNNASLLKMMVSSIAERSLKAEDLLTLTRFINATTKKSAFEELIEDQVKLAIEYSAKANPDAVKFNASMLKGFGYDRTQNQTTGEQLNSSRNIDMAFEKSRDPNKKRRGISVFDFDDTLAKTKSNVLYTLPDGTKGKLNATEFAKKSEALEAKGAKFDFSEFSKVVKGELGPLFSEAQKKEGKYSNKDIFVLTARPANSAKAIMEFLKSEGLEIPMNNIVGLGNGAASAKADWMIGKVAEGYNDFYFADDAIKNVTAVKDALGLFDIKSKVQQAIMSSKNITLENELAKMIERKKGISSEFPISPAVASNVGKKKGRFDWFIPPNAEDFQGLMYKFYGRGPQGDKDMALIKETLLRPFTRAENAISTYKQTLGADYTALEKQMSDLNKTIDKATKSKLEQANMNSDQATRVYLYDKLGYKIPGLEQSEIDNLVGIVKNDPRLLAYANGVMGITKTKELFPRPSETWYSSNIRFELFKYATEGVRSHFLKDWQKNVDEMFTDENFSRIEAAYGKDYTNNLKEILARMQSGKTRSTELGSDVQKGMDYINGSVGVIMFLNTRSAVLQTISAVNYVNWSDNNPLEVGKAIANPKEYAKTFVEIFNSDFLKQRRGGLEINVEEAEIAKAVERSKGQARHLYDYLIKVGFKPTQIADSFAIAFGGTPFLMNRTNTYVKQGLSLEAAKKRAYTDFRDVSEETQQSSQQDRVSNIQTGVAGRLIFAFGNTLMQMSRNFKKGTLDLAYNRGDRKTNISKMIYYGGVQSYIFYALQQSQFLRLFGGDDEDMTAEEKEFNEKVNDKKTSKILTSMFDSFILGTGSPGKVAITAKNTILKYYEEKAKGYKADYGNVLNEAISISPPLSSKTKKIYSAYKTYRHFSTKKGMKELETYGKYAFDNPMLMANAKVFSSFSNIPVDRVLNKVNNLYSAFTDETLTPIQSAALAAGWDKWSLGLYDPDFMTADEIAENEVKRKAELKKERIAKKVAALKSYNLEMGEPERRGILKLLTKKEQIDSLWSLGLDGNTIKELTKLKEIDRIERIIKLQNRKKFNQDMSIMPTTSRQDSLK